MYSANTLNPEARERRTKWITEWRKYQWLIKLRFKVNKNKLGGNHDMDHNRRKCREQAENRLVLYVNISWHHIVIVVVENVLSQLMPTWDYLPNLPRRWYWIYYTYLYIECKGFVGKARGLKNITAFINRSLVHAGLANQNTNSVVFCIRWILIDQL